MLRYMLLMCLVVLSCLAQIDFMPTGNLESNVNFQKLDAERRNAASLANWQLNEKNYEYWMGGVAPHKRVAKNYGPAQVITFNEQRFREVWAEAGNNLDLMNKYHSEIWIVRDFVPAPEPAPVKTKAKAKPAKKKARPNPFDGDVK